jgi:ribosome-associated protein
LTSKDLAMVAVTAALDKKALEPLLLDVSGQSTYTDYILLLSGRSDRHAQAVADAVRETLKRTQGKLPFGVEGERDGQWALLDFGDLVVHVFYHPVREFYDLEGLWIDAPRVPIDVPPDSRAAPDELYGHVNPALDIDESRMR